MSKKHLRVISNMITQLKSIGHVLYDEQQIRVIIQSYPTNWKQLQVNLTHNNSIKTFSNFARYVELEDECHGAAKTTCNSFVSSDTKSPDFKLKIN